MKKGILGRRGVLALVLALALLATTLLPVCAMAQAEAEFKLFDENGKKLNPDRSAIGQNGIVSSSRYEASQIGAQIFAAGGNAVDAAVATAFAIGVCEPFASGLGGGGFMTLHLAETEEDTFIDFREVAPMGASEKMYLDEAGNVIPDLSVHGGLSIGVPGEVAGLLYILDTYGTMTREQVIRPSVELAKNGYPVQPLTSYALVEAFPLFEAYPEMGKIYLNEGLPYSLGDTIKNPDLAKTLELIIEKGADGFYKGEVAQAIVDATAKYGGMLTLEDLANYHPQTLHPVKGSYRGYQIISSPPPSSGGTHLIQILNMMETFDFGGAIQPNTVPYIHLLSEIMKMSYADRATYMGDPHYVDVPIKGLTDKDYAKKLAAKIDLDKAQSYEADDPWAFEGDHTTHLSVADKHGNMVAITKSLNYYFGSGVVPDGYGFILNDQLDDFNPQPGHPNSVAAGKKPLSSMSPTIVLKENGDPFMVLGMPGGPWIFPTIAQVISNVIDYKMDMQQAINAVRIHDDLDGVLYYNDGDSDVVAPDVVEALTKMGHTLYYMKDDTTGYVQGALYAQDGIHGGADPYADGKAIGY
ncbi:MAG: gamma-glutamyltransferase [Clostridia bacterium]